MRIRRRLFGDVRANSNAVERPIPDDAPVIIIVLPASRFAMVVVDMVCWVRVVRGIRWCVWLGWRIERWWDWGVGSVRRNCLVVRAMFMGGAGGCCAREWDVWCGEVVDDVLDSRSTPPL